MKWSLFGVILVRSPFLIFRGFADARNPLLPFLSIELNDHRHLYKGLRNIDQTFAHKRVEKYPGAEFGESGSSSPKSSTLPVSDKPHPPSLRKRYVDS